MEQDVQKLRPISWSVVRALMSIPAVRWAGLFPFVGYLIIYNDKIIEYFRTRSTGIDVQGFDLFNLHCTFFGLMLIGIASFIYQISSPNELREYTNMNTFVTEIMRTITPLTLKIYSEDLKSRCKNIKSAETIEKKYKSASQIEITAPGIEAISVNQRWSSWLEENRYGITDILSGYYIARSNLRFKFLYWTCLIFALSGYILMIVPTGRIIVLIVSPLVGLATSWFGYSSATHPAP